MILCLGTTPVFQRTMVFDRLAVDEVNRAKQVFDYASGKSINAARVVHTLGQPVLATGFVGGARGESLRQDLDASGIAHDFVEVQPETRQCITVVDQSIGTATELVQESAAVGIVDWDQLESKLRQLLIKADTWIFSGTLAPGYSSFEFYARWLPLAQQHNAHAIIDASGEPLRCAMRHPNAVLKMNRQELARTIGEDLGDERKLLEKMIAYTPAQGSLIVTLGADGALASNGKSCWRIQSPKVQTVSAVGSGDAFAAGLAVALSQDQLLPEALKMAVACGAANAITKLAGHVDRNIVMQLAMKVQVEAVKHR